MHTWKAFSMENVFFFIDGEDMCEHHRLKTIINNAAEDLFPLGVALDTARG